MFHFVVSGGITYLCMADESFKRRIPFAFLEDIKNRFVSNYGDGAATANAYGMNNDFAPVLKRQLDYFSNDPSADQLRKVKGEIEDVKQVMVTNIDKVLQRGDKIDILVNKTEDLNQQAFKFKKSSTSLRRSMAWKNMKMRLMMFLVVVGVIYFFATLICGGFALAECFPPDDPGDEGERLAVKLAHPGLDRLRN